MLQEREQTAAHHGPFDWVGEGARGEGGAGGGKASKHWENGFSVSIFHVGNWLINPSAWSMEAVAAWKNLRKCVISPLTEHNRKAIFLFLPPPPPSPPPFFFLPLSPTPASCLLETTPAWINALPRPPLSFHAPWYLRFITAHPFIKKSESVSASFCSPTSLHATQCLGEKKTLLNYMAGILQDGLQRKVEVINKYCSKLKIAGQGTLCRPCVNDEDPALPLLLLLHLTKPRPSTLSGEATVCGADVKSIRHECHAECLIMFLWWHQDGISLSSRLCWPPFGWGGGAACRVRQLFIIIKPHPRP